MNTTAVRHQPRWSWLFLLGILLIPVAYSVPVLGSGLENLRMVAHFDHDEFYAYQAWHRVYEEGPLHAEPFNPNNLYPKLFYNLAGLALYPGVPRWADDVGLMLTVWRGLNLLATLGTLVVMFFLVRRVFRSTRTSLLSTLLLALTPTMLWWTSNVRPNPLEHLFALACLLVCVRLCERFRWRWFWGAAILGGLAFATKYGGIPFLVLLPAVAVFAIAREAQSTVRVRELLQAQWRHMRVIGPLLFAGCVGGLSVLGAGLWKHHGNAVAFVGDWAAAAFSRDALVHAQALLETHGPFVIFSLGCVGVALGATLIILLVTGCWLRVQATSDRARLGWGGRCGLAVLLGLYGIGAYGVVFVLSGPVFLAHPDHLVAQVGYILYHGFLGGAYGLVGRPSWLESLSYIGREFHPGWLALVPLLGLAIRDHLRGRVSGLHDTGVERRQRDLLWIYAILVIALSVGTRLISLRHVLTAMAVFYAFGVEAVLRRPLTVGRGRGRVAFATGLALLGILFVSHSVLALDQSRAKRVKSSDFGLVVGDWLSERYDPQTTIMTDYWPFYVPPRFAHTTSTYEAFETEARRDQWGEAVVDFLGVTNPDVLIAVEPRYAILPVQLDELLASRPALQVHGYELVRVFDNPSRHGRYATAQIYERAARPASRNTMAIVDRTLGQP